MTTYNVKVILDDAKLIAVCIEECSESGSTEVGLYLRGYEL